MVESAALLVRAAHAEEQTLAMLSFGLDMNQRAVVEKILRHLDLWSGTPPLAPARSPPGAANGPWNREPCDDVDPMPDYENILTD